MTDLLIRDIDPDLMLLIEQRARTHNRNVSEEAKALIRAGLNASEHDRKMGTWMRNLVPPEYRGDDLVSSIAIHALRLLISIDTLACSATE